MNKLKIAIIKTVWITNYKYNFKTLTVAQRLWMELKSYLTICNITYFRILICWIRAINAKNFESKKYYLLHKNNRITAKRNMDIFSIPLSCMPDASMLDSYHPKVAPAMWYIAAAPMQYRSTQNTICIWLTTI